jgi:polysaccharide deacetylase family protein (PEP-CTERM system associated)
MPDTTGSQKDTRIEARRRPATATGRPIPYTTRQGARGPLNAMTIDLEDWPVAVLGPHQAVTPCVLANTERVLTLLAECGVRATFFALGRVCEQYPQLLQWVTAAGHEVGTHGYGHELVHHMTPRHFREDLRRSIDVIGSQTGRAPLGYRAPAFSIGPTSLWAAPILADEGIRYSSSVFPIAGPRYGMPGAPRFPFRWPDCELIEFPLTTVCRWGRNLPVAGGGYFRLLPAALINRALREINGQGQPVVVYAHPYELNPRELRDLRRGGLRFSRKTQFKQGLFRGRMAGRLVSILSRFAFAPLAEVLNLA